MHISTWCIFLVGQWLFYSFFLFISTSVHLSCMSIDNRYCYFNSVVCFVYRFKRVLKNNSIVLYVVELLREHPSENHAVLKYGSTSTLTDFAQILCRVPL